jgi:hypothetical protein
MYLCIPITHDESRVLTNMRPEHTKNHLWEHLNQGDQIGRFFDYWAIAYFGQVC